MKRVNFNTLPKELLIPKDDGLCNHLIGKEIPNVSLISSSGDYVKLRRQESFKLIVYCYPMTGRPDEPLPENWNNIPGARGCTLQNCSIRDNYDEFIKLNAEPLGITTQSIYDIREMSKRLKISHDILSDNDLIFTKSLKLPTFSINEKIFLKRVTMIVEDYKIIKVYYPVFPPDKNTIQVLKWLKKNI